MEDNAVFTLEWDVYFRVLARRCSMLDVALAFSANRAISSTRSPNKMDILSI